MKKYIFVLLLSFNIYSLFCNEFEIRSNYKIFINENYKGNLIEMNQEYNFISVNELNNKKGNYNEFFNELNIKIKKERSNKNEYWKIDDVFIEDLGKFDEFGEKINVPIKRIFKITEHSFQGNENLIKIEEYIIVDKNDNYINYCKEFNLREENIYIYDDNIKEIKEMNGKSFINYNTLNKDKYKIIKEKTVKNKNYIEKKISSEIKKYEKLFKEYNINNIKIDCSGENIKFKIDNIMFLPDSYLLNEKYIKEIENLNTIFKILKPEIEIYGYCADVGDKESINWLSEKRALEVKKQLNYSNVISCKGNGAINPVGDNNNEEGRKLNRRVEIKVINMK